MKWTCRPVGPDSELTDCYGTEIKWMRIPSHICIWGNEQVDRLADLGRRKSPLLFGRISVSPGCWRERHRYGDMRKNPPCRRKMPPPRPTGRREHHMLHQNDKWDAHSRNHCITTVGCGGMHANRDTQVP